MNSFSRPMVKNCSLPSPSLSPWPRQRTEKFDYISSIKSSLASEIVTLETYRPQFRRVYIHPSDHVFHGDCHFLFKEGFWWGQREGDACILGLMANHERRAEVRYFGSTACDLIGRDRRHWVDNVHRKGLRDRLAHYQRGEEPIYMVYDTACICLLLTNPEKGLWSCMLSRFTSRHQKAWIAVVDVDDRKPRILQYPRNRLQASASKLGLK